MNQDAAAVCSRLESKIDMMIHAFEGYTGEIVRQFGRLSLDPALVLAPMGAGIPAAVLERQCQAVYRIQRAWRKAKASPSKAPTPSGVQSAEDILVLPQARAMTTAMLPGAIVAGLEQVSMRMETATTTLEGLSSRIERLDSMLETCCGMEAVGNPLSFQSPWLFLDRVELGHLSASCFTNHRRVEEWTPFAAASEEYHTGADLTENEEQYYSSGDDLDCDEMEEIYQKAAAEEPGDVERRFGQLLEARRGKSRQRLER